MPSTKTVPTQCRGVQRVVTLYSGRAVSLGAYVAAWKRAKGLPKTVVVADGPGSWAPMTIKEVLVRLEEGLHDRINRHLPGFGRGRKWDPTWQVETSRAARDVNTPRLVVRWVPMHLRARLAHRLHDPQEDL